MDLKELDQILQRKTRAAIVETRRKFKEEAPLADPEDTEDYILFVGTGGNPEAVMTQSPATAGFILNLAGFKMYVDPGPGAITLCRQGGIDLRTLDAVYISHSHIDHYAGAESVIEGMCWAMSARRGLVLGPGSLFDEDHTISTYHQGDTGPHGYKGGPEIIFLQEGQEVCLPGLTLTPVRAYHGRENYGFIIRKGDFRLGYTGDTNYIRSYRSAEGLVEVTRGQIIGTPEIVDYRQDLKRAFGEVDLLIANVTAHNAWPHRHITSYGLVHLLRGSRVKECIMSHFNYSCVEPEDLRDLMARYVEEAAGIPTRAAKDLEKVPLRRFTGD